MKTQLNVFMALALLIAAFSCKPKMNERSGVEKNTNAAPADQRVPSEYKASEAATNQKHVVNTAERLDVKEPRFPSFDKLDKEMMDALALIPAPKNREEDAVINDLFHKTLERKKELLFSIPVNPQAKKDFGDAWKTLETTSFFDNKQDLYVRDLILRYSEAPQLERLVIWRLIRLRIEAGLKRGSATAEEALKIEMAKFLLSALGIDKHELFEAMHLKTRSLSEEAGRKGNQAEEEVVRIYSEQSKKAETILENYLK